MAIDYEDIRRRAEKKARKRIEFMQHAGIYVVVNFFLWAFFGFIALFVAHEPAVLIPAVLTTLGWGIGLGAHWVNMLAETSGLDRYRENEIQKEIAREMARRGMTPEDLYEKPKRDRAARLSDDGELVYDEDRDDQEEAPRRARRSRSDR